MNYRHAYHAGNFADVIKHAVLARIVEYLKLKDKPFRVVDTHAGVGLYDLSGTEARSTGEWRDGIGRLVEAPPGGEAGRLLAPYLEAIAAANSGGDVMRYPGSPWIARRLLRRQDRLSAIERHPEDAQRLARLFSGDVQVRVIELDGWLALGAHLPPKERRGLVLVDPPFEETGEFERIVEGLVRARRRWAGGTYAVWYPLKDRVAMADFVRSLRGTGIPKMLDIRLTVRAPSSGPRLDGSGMVVVNPPFTLETELRTILPALHEVLAQEAGGSWSVEWLSDDHGGA